MIYSLMANNGAFAQLGNLQTQPVTTDPSYIAKKQSTIASSPNSMGVTPASQANINTPMIMHNGASMELIKSPSLSQMVTAITTNSKYSLPPLHSTVNTILPSYALHLSPIVPFDRHTLDAMAVTNKKFEPYEQLTSISQDRPEIVMMSGFLPLFEADKGHSRQSFTPAVETTGIYPFMTDAGKFIDAQMHIRNLRNANFVNLHRNLMYRYPVISDTFQTRSNAFYAQIDALQASANFLLSLVRSTDRLKSQLDLRDDLHVVDTQSVIKNYVVNYSRARDASLAQGLTDYANRFLPQTYNLYQTLVRLGYADDSIKNDFSSTKIWLQLLLEMRDIMRFHSLEFLDINPTAQKSDDNASILTKPNVTLFGIRSDVAAVPNIKTLSNVQVAGMNDTIGTLEQTFKTMYEDVHFKTDETKIAALANLVSKEFRYSQGLAQPDVIKSLNDYFSYTPGANGNFALFDAVLGRFGNNISDIPSAQTNDLASLAQQQPASNVAVLTFEAKYIDGDTGTLTPGSSFYINQVMETTDGTSFDTKRPDDLASLLEAANKQFSTIVNGMNLLSTHVSDPNDPNLNKFQTTLINPVELMQSLTNQIVDTKGNTLPVIRDDRLGSVYSQAYSDNKIKAALFLYTISRMTRNYSQNFSSLNSQANADNTPLTDAIVELMVDTLASTTPQTKDTKRIINPRLNVGTITSDTLTHDSIKTAMKQGTKLTNIIETTMSNVLAAFKLNNNAIQTDETRYGKITDSVLMMATFDMIVAIVAKFGNQSITASHFGKSRFNLGTLTFTVTRTSVNYQNAQRDLINRMERELALAQQLVYSVLNTLQKLSGSLRGYSNYLKSPSTIQQLKEISSIISDQTLFHLLLSEQQIFVLSAAVSDILSRVHSSGQGEEQQSTDASAFNVDDSLKVLDDSIVSPKLRDAVFGMFSTDEFSAQTSNNKKVMTVGIPLGFTQRLKQRLSVTDQKKSSFADKQTDIVQVVVYKVDLENSDIVYKPQRFLFELSRFPVKNDGYFLPLSDKPSIEDIINAIPTRDATQNVNDDRNAINYWTSKNTDLTNYKPALNGDEYEFLSQREKFEIVKNHVYSHLLEVYTKLLTGISLADYHFDLVDPPKTTELQFTKLIIDHHAASLVSMLNVGKALSVSQPAENNKPVGGVLFAATAPRSPQSAPNTMANSNALSSRKLSNSAGVAGSIDPSVQFKSTAQKSPAVVSTSQRQGVPSANVSLNSISHRNVSVVLQDIRTISNSANMLTPLADPLAVSQRLLKPKQFDRVFNVIFDPDDFEIDEKKTTKTPHGSQALAQMILKGDVIPETPGEIVRGSLTAMSHGVLPRDYYPGSAEPNVNKYRYRDRNKDQGDMTFEKYFVTIETYGEDEV